MTFKRRHDRSKEGPPRKFTWGRPSRQLHPIRVENRLEMTNQGPEKDFSTKPYNVMLDQATQDLLKIGARAPIKPAGVTIFNIQGKLR